MKTSLVHRGRLGARRLRIELSNISDRLYLGLHPGAAPTRRPDFLIMGAMKAGTTALHNCLGQHPDIFMTYIKEPSYYLNRHPDRPVHALAQTEDALLKLMFRGYRNEKRVGESTTKYSEAPTKGLEAPKNIFEQSPDMQFIYIVRNPLARIVSHYLHCVERGIFTEPMSAVLARDPTFLERSLYYSQIKRYLEYFDKKQILLLYFEEFSVDPAATVAEACRFLGVDEGPAQSVHLKQSNKTLVPESVRKVNSKFDQSAYAGLIDKIREDVGELQEFAGRDLSFWDLSAEKWTVVN